MKPSEWVWELMAVCLSVGPVMDWQPLQDVPCVLSGIENRWKLSLVLSTFMPTYQRSKKSVLVSAGPQHFQPQNRNKKDDSVSKKHFQESKDIMLHRFLVALCKQLSARLTKKKGFQKHNTWVLMAVTQTLCWKEIIFNGSSHSADCKHVPDIFRWKFLTCKWLPKTTYGNCQSSWGPICSPHGQEVIFEGEDLVLGLDLGSVYMHECIIYCLLACLLKHVRFTCTEMCDQIKVSIRCFISSVQTPPAENMTCFYL